MSDPEKLKSLRQAAMMFNFSDAVCNGRMAPPGAAGYQGLASAYLPPGVYRYKLKPGLHVKAGQMITLSDLEMDEDAMNPPTVFKCQEAAAESAFFARQLALISPPDAPIYQCKVEGWRYDGLLADECLERYTQMQRGDLRIVGKDGSCATHAGGPFPPLTPAQLACAKRLWSAQLATLQANTRHAEAEREKNHISVDDDRWEE